jgi:MFS family permease
MKIQRNISLLSWFNFCLDFRIYNAIAILYFAEVTGSYALALGIFSVVTISSSLFELPTGILSDRIGRKKTLLLGQMSTILSIFFYALGWSFLILVFGAILEWLAKSLYSGNNSALLYDSLKEMGKENEYGTYEGKVSSMFQIALGISAVIGTFTLGFESFQFLFWISLIPQILGLGIAFSLIEPKLHEKKIEPNIFAHISLAIDKFRTNLKLRNLSIASIVALGINEPIHNFYPAFMATLWPAWAIPLAKTWSHIFAAIGFRMSGKIIERYGAKKTVLWENGVNYIVSTLIIAFPSILTPLIRSITSLGFGIGSVAQNSLFQKEFTDAQRATMGSLNALAWSLFVSLFSILLGAVADAIGIYYALLWAQILAVSAVFLYKKALK